MNNTTKQPENKITSLELSMGQGSMMFDILSLFRGANAYDRARRMGPFYSFASRTPL